MTVQTAFRLDESMVRMMKQRARLKKMSVNAYVSNLIEEDLRNSSTLPQVALPANLDQDIARFAGVIAAPAASELDADERLKRIWER